MGAISKVIGGIFGGNQPKAQPVAQPAAPKPTLDELIGTEEERAKQKRVALNAAGESTDQLGVTAPATVARRNLLGL